MSHRRHRERRPRTWVPVEGDSLLGTFEHTSKRFTRWGKAADVVVIEDGRGQTWELWILGPALERAWWVHGPRPGDYMAIRRLEDKVQRDGRAVPAFDVCVERRQGRARRSAAGGAR